MSTPRLLAGAYRPTWPATLLLLLSFVLNARPVAARKPVLPSPPVAVNRAVAIDAAMAAVRRLYAEHNYQQAYDALNAIYQTQKQPGLLAFMCMCEINLGRADEAEQLIQQLDRSQLELSVPEQEQLAQCKNLTRSHRLIFLGVQQCDSDKYRDGIKNLAEADHIEHVPDLLLNIGLCYIKDRNLLEAERACEQFKQEVPQRTEEQSQGLSACEAGIALLRKFDKCRDLFSQRIYSEAISVCQAVNKSTLDDEIRAETLLRLGYSQARSGHYAEAMEACTTVEKTRPKRDTETEKLLSDCKELAQKGLAPLPRAQPTAPPTKPWYKKWWVWTAAGVGVAALAVGLGVGLAPPQPAPDHQTFIWN